MNDAPTNAAAPAPFGAPVQIAYAVEDVHVAAERWRRMGAGPFVIVEHIPLASARWFGVPCEFDHSSAYGQWGEVMVELVCDHGGLTATTQGLHHVAFMVDDLGAAQATAVVAGWPEALFARTQSGTTPFAFHDARGDLGHFVELYERSPRLEAFYAHVRSLAS
jgi:hypothetical protein